MASRHIDKMRTTVASTTLSAINIHTFGPESDCEEVFVSLAGITVLMVGLGAASNIGIKLFQNDTLFGRRCWRCLMLSAVRWRYVRFCGVNCFHSMCKSVPSLTGLLEKAMNVD